jgi:hypothetical protein
MYTINYVVSAKYSTENRISQDPGCSTTIEMDKVESRKHIDDGHHELRNILNKDVYFALLITFGASTKYGGFDIAKTPDIAVEYRENAHNCRKSAQTSAIG